MDGRKPALDRVRPRAAGAETAQPPRVQGPGKHVFVSTATLHRYCAGKALPADFAFVKRLGRLVGVRAKELDALYRLWLRAQLEGDDPARR